MTSATSHDAAMLWDEAARYGLRYIPELSPVIVERAQGSTLYLADGRSILDFTSGQMSAVLGHGHPAVVEAVSEAVATVTHLFGGMLAPSVIELWRRLALSLPDPLEKVMLLSTGAESNEAAIRLAKLVTARHGIVSFDRSWHGMTMGAAGATYAASHEGYGPSAPGNFAIPTPGVPPTTDEPVGARHEWRSELDRAFDSIDAQSRGQLAACLVEPILSSGGVIVPPAGYLSALRDKCHERGMLLIFDEAQTGLYRTGDMYALEAANVVPDIVTLSKTLGAGFPVAAVITSAAIEQRAHERGFLFLTTHVSDPLAASVANTVLDVLARDGIGENVQARGRQLASGLHELSVRHELVTDARGRGLLRAIEFASDPVSKRDAAAVGRAVTTRCLALGLHLNIVQLPHLGGALRLAPPLTITHQEIDRGLAMLDQAIADVTTTGV